MFLTVIKLSGDGINSVGIKVESYAVARKLTVESSGTGLSLSETMKSTWDCSSSNCSFAFRVSSSIFGN